MTLPVPNQRSAIAEVRQGGPRGKIVGLAYLIPPWNNWFQQFSQKAPSVNNLNVGTSPFSYTANANGNLIISGGTVSLIQLIRGSSIIPIATSTATPRIVPISLGDEVVITYSVLPTVQFLGA